MQTVCKPEGTGESEISQFENSFFRDEYISRFQIAVEDFVRMESIQSVKQLVGELFLFSQ